MDNKKAAAKKLQKSYFDVLGLCCSSEVPLIEKILKSLDGVKDITVIVPTRTVVVVHDPLLISQLDIVKALNQARLEANARAYGDNNYQKKWPSPYAVACGVLLLLSFFKYVYPPLKWLAIAAVAVGLPPIILRAIAATRNLTLDINLLMLIAVGGSIALEDYWEAATIVFLFTTAEWLEARASHKATAVMSSLVNLLPQRAVLAESHEEVNADKVKLNTILAVKPGEVIPIDGVVVEGTCEVDEKTLTGESFPVSKEKDSSVWAGTINLNGYIHIKTRVLAEDCVVARMVKLVEDAQNNKSRTQRFIDKCAKYYTPAVVTISACFAIIPAALRVQDQKHWDRLALVILVSACPCALILSTPVAMFCALSKAAASGLLFKGAEYLETLSEIKIMAFDKTGTITRGEFAVMDFRSILDDFSLETMLHWVSSIESKSSHPMAAALVDYAQSHSITPTPDKVEQFQNFPGEGIYGRIEGKDIYVGNSKISLRAGCSSVPTLEDDTVEGKSIGFIFLGSCPAGFFSLSDVCRTGVNDALNELKLMGIKTVMLTGDSCSAAKHAQNQLGGALDAVHAELLPEHKARIIQELQKEAPTAMIGDGINDAPALGTADIGISMGVSGSALATETGNVILMTNDITRIPKALRLARRVKRKVIKNVILSISTKAVILALAIAGHPLVWAAVLCDVGTCLLVIFNSMLLLRGTKRCKRKCCKKSAASHSDKQNCETTSHWPSHSHQASCPDHGTCEERELKRCSSTMCTAKCQFDASTANSYGKNACTESIVSRGCHSGYKCCKTAAASPIHEHTVKTPSHHSSHAHQASCADIEISDKRVLESCSSNMFTAKCKSDHSSSKPCGKNICSESTKKHGCCPSTNQLYEAKDPDHECCDIGEETRSCHRFDHKCLDQVTHSRENKCSNSVQKYSRCAVDGEIQDLEHCNHIEPSTNTLNDSQLVDEEVGNLVRICCKNNLPKQEGLCRHKGHAAGCKRPVCAIINILRGNDHVNCTGINTCSSLKKRQVGGCCRKACCRKSSHVGGSFRGGLSEIVIE